MYRNTGIVEGEADAWRLVACVPLVALGLTAFELGMTARVNPVACRSNGAQRRPEALLLHVALACPSVAACRRSSASAPVAGVARARMTSRGGAGATMARVGAAAARTGREKNHTCRNADRKNESSHRLLPPGTCPPYPSHHESTAVAALVEVRPRNRP